MRRSPNDDAALAAAPYRVLADWQEDYEGNLRIILPDTYGTEGFLERAPDWLAHWTGIRIDSGDPDRGRRDRDRLVEGARPGSGAEAGDLLRRARRRDDRDAARAISHGRAAHRLRLGHAADQRLPRPRAARRARPVLDRLQGHRRQRPAGGQAVRQPQQGGRPARPRSSATSACSATPAQPPSRSPC